MQSERYKGYVRARLLRNKQTEPEELAWEILRGRKIAGYKFRRQHPIGGYVLDFFCAEALLAIELDGQFHADSWNLRNDSIRTQYLNARNIRVLRFWNDEIVHQPGLVSERIFSELISKNIHSPLHLVERGWG